MVSAATTGILRSMGDERATVPMQGVKIAVSATIVRTAGDGSGREQLLQCYATVIRHRRGCGSST